MCIHLVYVLIFAFPGRADLKGVLVGSNAGVMSVEFDTEVYNIHVTNLLSLV